MLARINIQDFVKSKYNSHFLACVGQLQVKDHIKELLAEAVIGLSRDGVLPEGMQPNIMLERTRNPEHGDFASNLALTLAKIAHVPPRDLATKLVAELPDSVHIEKVELAGPGFINFFVRQKLKFDLVKQIRQHGADYGSNQAEEPEKLNLEFVSANPTGPLHVGHGRGAAYGASLANILRKYGHQVDTEYYVNDNGRQMDILAASVWLRYLELCGEQVVFPDNAYLGDYIYDIARDIRETQGDDLRAAWLSIQAAIDEIESPDADGEKRLDALVKTARSTLGEDHYAMVFDAALNEILAGIKQDLADFGVDYECWFSERSLETDGSIARAMGRLEDNGHLYRKDGALWFRATQFADEKDRVVVRENGDGTYFRSDIAYLLDKFSRDFEKAIYVWGADHHGYVPRMQAATVGLNEDPERMEVTLIQFAHLYRAGEKVQMGTRSGQFVTLRALFEEVGVDSARFFYVMRSHEQHLDFDLELAKSQSSENPVFYVQYANARVNSVFGKLQELGWSHNSEMGDSTLDQLTEEHEEALVTLLARYPEIIALAAKNRTPHTLAQYLRDLAHGLHTWYNAHKILIPEEELRNARLNLAEAVSIVLKDGLTLLGVSTPESM